MKGNKIFSAQTAIAGLLVAVLAGCTGLLIDKPPPKLFKLTPKTTFEPNLPRVSWQLTIEPPIAEAALNTSRIAVMNSAVALDYYQGVNWVDTAPKMVQTLLVESFENSGKILSVGRQSVSLRTDYTIITELREFQSELDKSGHPVIHVRINAKLVKFPERVIVSTTSAGARVPADSKKMTDIIHAFDSALGKTLKQIVEWGLVSAPPNDRRPR